MDDRLRNMLYRMVELGGIQSMAAYAVKSSICPRLAIVATRHAALRQSSDRLPTKCDMGFHMRRCYDARHTRPPPLHHHYHHHRHDAWADGQLTSVANVSCTTQCRYVLEDGHTYNARLTMAGLIRSTIYPTWSRCIQPP